MEQFDLEVRIDLLAQIIYVNIDDVGKSIVIDTPDMLGDHGAARPVLTAQQHSSKATAVNRWLLARHLRFAGSRRKSASSSIPARQPAAQSRARAPAVFEGERLCQIVVGADIEAGDFVSPRREQ
jgi:hypothetical protein